MFGERLQHCTDLAQLLDIFHMIFDANQVGITVVRADGVIIYYNEAQARLDALSPQETLGKKICDVYHFTPEDSPTMRALRTGKPVFDSVHYYRTRHGKLVNSANAIYPLWAHGVLLGGICFIQSYTAIGRQVGFMRGVGESGKGGNGPASSRKKVPEKTHYLFSSLIGESPLLLEAASLAKKVSQSSSSIMLVGETGVGKEIFAQAVHYEGPRRGNPYMAINCSAVPETLLEGILFGTARGAFTGAVNRPGLFEAANGGTLYLDEVDSMPISLQNKLLRVLQEKKVRRVGEGHERPIDVRIVSSVGKNPLTLVEEGLLRQDFYYRLGVVKIQIPPLRFRMEDIHLLVQHFLQLHCSRLDIAMPLVSPEAMAVLYAHAWPGNVRELEHAIEASLVLVESGDSLEPWHLYHAVPDFNPVLQPQESTTPWLAFQDMHRSAKPPVAAANRPLLSPGGASILPEKNVLANTASSQESVGSSERNVSGLRGSLSEQSSSFEVAALEKALRTSAGNVAMAARLLGISPQLMHYKMKKHSIDKGAFMPERL